MLLQDIAYLDKTMEVKEHQDIRIQDTCIHEIANHGCLTPYPKEECLSGKGLLVMPGLCDAHMHTGQQLLKGCVLDASGMIWKDIMLPFESTLTDEIMQLNAELAALEMIRNGTTSFLDAGSYHMDAAAKIYAQSGLRAQLTCSTMDDASLPIQIQDDVESALAKNDAFYDTWHQKGNLKVSYSLRTLLSVSERLIKEIHAHAKARNALLQVHMNEYEQEVHAVIAKYGMRPYTYLDQLKILDERFVGAHSLIVDEEEISLMQKHHTHVVLCPFSNSAKALAPYPTLKKQGLLLALGSDGSAHGGLSLWNEMRQLRCMIHVTHGIANHDRHILSAKELLHMAITNGTALMQEKNLGCIKPGYLADLIFLNIHQPHLYPSGNLTNTLVECVEGHDVLHSMVNGKWLMKDHKILTLDEKAIFQKAVAFQRKS